MDKIPFSVAKHNLEMELGRIVNECGLPICVIEYIVRDLYESVKIASREQLRNDIASIGADIDGKIHE